MGVCRIGTVDRAGVGGVPGAASVSRVDARQLVVSVEIVSFFDYLIWIGEVDADVAVVVSVVAVV